MIGSILRGRYELSGLIVDGPIFHVYTARDRVAGREVSIRIVREGFNTPALYEALGGVVKQQQTVAHPSLERLTDVDQDGKLTFLVGELTRAPSLSDRIRKLAPFSAPVAVSTAISIARGLDALHKSGLAHGDISSDNAVVLADGEVKLQLAGVWQAYSASPAAGAAVLPEMAPYLAPEVTAGGLPSPQADVYALGVLLYELLTGRKPFQGETALATAMKHAHEPTPGVRTLNQAVPVVLEEIVKKAMAKSPADRYASAGDLAADLRLMQDALRFGRTLTWPLRGGSQPAKAAAGGAVAPKMSAIRDESERERQRQRPERDVPVWMLMMVVALAAVALSLVGMYIMGNLNRPRMVQIPNVRGLSIEEARATLSNLKFKMKIGAAIPNDKVEPDRVVEIEPMAGIRAREGSTVTVTLSAGGRFTEVPDVRGFTADRARSVLEKVYLLVDPELTLKYDPTTEPGTVIEQEPPPSTKTARDTKVKLTVADRIGPPVTEPPPTGEAPAAGPATGPPAGAPPANSDPFNPQGAQGDEPAEQRKFVYSLKISLGRLAKDTQVRVDITDSEGTRTVYDAKVSKVQKDAIPVSATGVGEEATFSIYYDDRLVKRFTQPAVKEP